MMIGAFGVTEQGGNNGLSLQAEADVRTRFTYLP